MFELFTDRARRVIVLAQEEGRRGGHVSVDVGHIGLGALTASNGAGLDDPVVTRIRDALQLTLTDLTTDYDHRGHVPFTPDSKDLLERGLALSAEQGRDHVSSRDLLVAALTDPRVSAALAAQGASLDQIRTMIDTGSAGPDDTRPGGLHRPG